jgi:hypothetical protein
LKKSKRKSNNVYLFAYLLPRGCQREFDEPGGIIPNAYLWSEGVLSSDPETACPLLIGHTIYGIEGQEGDQPLFGWIRQRGRNHDRL